MLKFAIAASAKIAPGGPLCVNLVVPVRLRVAPRDDVFVLAVWPAGTATTKVEITTPDVSNRVRVPLRAPPVVFRNEKSVSNEPLVLQAGLNSVASDQPKVSVSGPPVVFTSLA